MREVFAVLTDIAILLGCGSVGFCCYLMGYANGWKQGYLDGWEAMRNVVPFRKNFLTPRKQSLD
jgi:hypothetical protein